MHDQNINFDENLSKILVIVFFTVLLLIGFLIYKDFGLTCDEPLDRNTAAANLKYILTTFGAENFARSFMPNFDNTVALENFVDRDYGVTFHLPAYLIELIFFRDDFAQAFKARHLLNFLYVYVGLIAFYCACHKIFCSRICGIVAVLLFVLTPRFFAESFYNGKDLIVVAFACINLYTLSAFLQKPSIRNICLHALSTALIIDTRIIGLAFLACSMGLIAVRGLLRSEFKQMLLQQIVYFVIAFILIIAFFPYLWADPLGRLSEVFSNMAAFRHDGLILFRGIFANVHHLPREYVPVWIAVTTPVFILSGFVLGLVYFIIRNINNLRVLASKALADNLNLFILFNVVIVFGSTLSVIILHSSLYNGWRQLYFIYPAMIVINVYALYMLYKVRGRVMHFVRNSYYVLYALGAIFSLTFNVTNHPYQNVYFNVFAQKPWIAYYDVDYWGNATHLAYEKLLAMHTGAVRYCHESMIFRANREGLPSKELERLVRVPCSLAQYRINNFFGRSADDYVRLRSLQGTRVFEVKAGDQVVLEVLKGPASLQ